MALSISVNDTGNPAGLFDSKGAGRQHGDGNASRRIDVASTRDRRGCVIQTEVNISVEGRDLESIFNGSAAPTERLLSQLSTRGRVRAQD